MKKKFKIIISLRHLEKLHHLTRKYPISEKISLSQQHIILVTTQMRRTVGVIAVNIWELHADSRKFNTQRDIKYKKLVLLSNNG